MFSRFHNFNICSLVLVSTGTTALSVATVRAQAPAIVKYDGLSLGMIITNTTNTISPTSSGAGSFETDIPAFMGSSYASLTFILPTSLTSGSNSMPISFDGNSAAYNSSYTTLGATTFNPASGHSGTLPVNSPVVRYFWLGGSTSPNPLPFARPAGTYDGVFTLSVNH